jgi:predicted component of type VI protein secretion system
MTSISLPLRVTPKGIAREEKLKKSIDSSISLILSTAQFSTPADPQFGFVFNNLRFEMFNENEGVVYDSGDTDSMDGLQGIYDKKISGSSKSINTFASELKESVAKYERRLEDVTVSMTYIREERQIYITVKGVISSTKENYVYKQIFRIWN